MWQEFPNKKISDRHKYGKHHRLNGNKCCNCLVDHPHHRHCVRVLVFEFWNKQRWKTMQVWLGKCYRRPRATALCASTGAWSAVAFSCQVCALFLYLPLKTKVFLIHCTLYFTGHSSAPPFFCQVCALFLYFYKLPWSSCINISDSLREKWPSKGRRIFCTEWATEPAALSEIDVITGGDSTQSIGRPHTAALSRHMFKMFKQILLLTSNRQRWQ